MNVENIQKDLNQIKKSYQQKFFHWTDEFVMKSAKERLYDVVSENLNNKELEQFKQHTDKLGDESVDILLKYYNDEVQKKGIVLNSVSGNHVWDFDDPKKSSVQDFMDKIDTYQYPGNMPETAPEIQEEQTKRTYPPKKIKLEPPKWGKAGPAEEEKDFFNELIDVEKKAQKEVDHAGEYCSCDACRSQRERQYIKQQAVVQVEQLDIRPGDRLLITLNSRRPNGQNYSASTILRITKELEAWAGVPVKLVYADLINKITIIRDEDDLDEWHPDRD